MGCGKVNRRADVTRMQIELLGLAATGCSGLPVVWRTRPPRCRVRPRAWRPWPRQRLSLPRFSTFLGVYSSVCPPPGPGQQPPRCARVRGTCRRPGSSTAWCGRAGRHRSAPTAPLNGLPPWGRSVRHVRVSQDGLVQPDGSFSTGDHAKRRLLQQSPTEASPRLG